MKKMSVIMTASILTMLSVNLQAQTKTTVPKTKYDTMIVKHVYTTQAKPAKKPVPQKPVEKAEIVLPVPEYINQPYYYDKDGNKLTKLENVSAQMVTKKKTLGLKGAKQFLTMEAPASNIRFTAKKDIVFFIKTSGDVIDLTSYIKLYQLIPADQKREVTVTSKEGILNDKDDAKGKLINFSVKMISKDNYMIMLPEQLEAGEYGFVWVKNMELTEFTVFGFGINWKSSD